MDANQPRRSIRTLLFSLFLIIVFSMSVQQGAPPADAASTDPIAHDPTIIQQGDYYYSFITGDAGTRTYIPIRRSKDLVHWTFLGTVFDTPPVWVVEELGFIPNDFWAPDINYFNGKYYLYYSASQFGTNNSVTGLATNTTLDPDSPAYEWVDEGMVFRSQDGDDFNAIDAEITFDEAGVPWMAFGSFWDGIKMRRVDATTGKLSDADPTLYSLASRGGDAIEGPSIVRRGDYYYLFVSFDFCCRGVDSTYRIMVGRSTRLHGPYYDQNGDLMLEGGGTELLRGYNEFAGPGHGDVFINGDTYWFAHHYYDVNDGGAPRLSMREISWVDGWPVLGEPLSGSEGVGRGGAYFNVVNRRSHKVLDADDCGYDGANIQLWTQLDSSCQQWRLNYRGGGYYSLLNKHSNKVADVVFCGTADGTNIAQWGWLNNDCQKYRFIPTGDGGWLGIENKNSAKVMDPADCAVRNGTNIQLGTWADNACQQFRLEPAGAIKIVNLNSSKVLDGVDCDDGGEVAVVQRGSADDDCQLWRFTHTDNGYYVITNQQSGKRLDLAGCNDDDSALVLSSSKNTDACQQWRLDLLHDGTFKLVNRNSQQVVEVADCSTDDGAVVKQGDWMDNACQRFKLVVPVP